MYSGLSYQHLHLVFSTSAAVLKDPACMVWVDRGTGVWKLTDYPRDDLHLRNMRIMLEELIFSSILLAP